MHTFTPVNTTQTSFLNDFFNIINYGKFPWSCRYLYVVLQSVWWGSALCLSEDGDSCALTMERYCENDYMKNCMTEEFADYQHIHEL